MTAALAEPLVTKQSTFNDWTEKGKDIFARLQETEDAHEQSQWAIGEWLLKGEEQFHKKAYEAANEITGWELGTLRNVAWVVSRFREPSLRSDTVLKWSHFKELARIADEEKRLELLERLDDGFPKTVLQVRAEVDKVLDKEKKPAKHGAPKAFYLHTSLKQEERNIFKALAKKQKKRPEELLRILVLDFIAEHKGEVEVKSKSRKRR